jgi:hypothetical protein
MGKYRKKPVVIEAIQWTGKNIEEIRAFCKIKSMGAFLTHTGLMEHTHDRETQKYGGCLPIELSIMTMEGEMNVPKGNFIIRGIKEELYSCDPIIFEKTYEKID